MDSHSFKLNFLAYGVDSWTMDSFVILFALNSSNHSINLSTYPPNSHISIQLLTHSPIFKYMAHFDYSWHYFAPLGNYFMVFMILSAIFQNQRFNWVIVLSFWCHRKSLLWDPNHSFASDSFFWLGLLYWSKMDSSRIKTMRNGSYGCQVLKSERQSFFIGFHVSPAQYAP